MLMERRNGLLLVVLLLLTTHESDGDILDQVDDGCGAQSSTIALRCPLDGNQVLHIRVSMILVSYKETCPTGDNTDGCTLILPFNHQFYMDTLAACQGEIHCYVQTDNIYDMPSCKENSIWYRNYVEIHYDCIISGSTVTAASTHAATGTANASTSKEVTTSLPSTRETSYTTSSNIYLSDKLHQTEEPPKDTDGDVVIVIVWMFLLLILLICVVGMVIICKRKGLQTCQFLRDRAKRTDVPDCTDRVKIDAEDNSSAYEDAEYSEIDETQMNATDSTNHSPAQHPVAISDMTSCRTERSDDGVYEHCITDQRVQANHLYSTVKSNKLEPSKDYIYFNDNDAIHVQRSTEDEEYKHCTTPGPS